MAKVFKFKQKQGVGELIINTPGEKVNILRSSALMELDQLLDNICHKHLDALVIKSGKEGVFIAGADINEIKDIQSVDDARGKATQGQHIFNKLESLPFPTIAVINGFCLGGGLEMALACTFRVSTDSPSTKIGLPEVNLGIIPGFGGTQRLSRLIGYTPALGLILAGKSVDGIKAFKLHITDACYPEGYLDFKLPQFIETVIRSPQSIIKKRARRGKLLPLAESFFLTRRIITHGVKKSLKQKTGNHYPAPLAALDVMHKTHNLPLKKGLSIEARYFGKVAPTLVSKNLIHIFDASQNIKKNPGIKLSLGKTSDLTHHVNSVAVLGAGVMGGGIAWLFSKIDLPVRMKDLSWDAVLKGFQQANKIYGQLKKIRRYNEREINNKLDKISGTLNYSGFKNTSLVVEAVVEDLKIKKSVLRELEKEVSDNTIIASNTSSLSINELSKALKKPDRFIGMHFFNPVNRMPLVEVIPGKKTSAKTIATIVALAKKTGKTPIVVQDGAGFAVNRVLLPYINEAGFLLSEGGNPKVIDKALCDFGMPMGPLALLDEVGIDVGQKVATILKEAFGERMKVCELFQELEGKKLLGKKSGQGIYIYRGRQRTINPDLKFILDKKGIRSKQIPKKEIVRRCIYIMINEASRCLTEKIVTSPEHLDLSLIMGTGFPPFRGGLLKYADSIGIDKIVSELEKLSRQCGERFSPSPLLQKIASQGSMFYS